MMRASLNVFSSAVQGKVRAALVASNDDASRRTVASQVAWRAKKGTTYWMAADGVKGGRVTGVGDLVLRLVRGA
jgi:hypothetical protein